MRAPAPVSLAAFALVAASSVVAFAQAAGVEGAIASKVAEDRGRLRAYDGVLVERGLVPGDPAAEVKSRVRFRAPSSVLVEVLEPAAYSGDVLARVGSNVHVYSRRLEAGVRLRHVPATDAASVRALIEATTRFDLATHGYREGERESVAGRAATTWTVTPREPTGFGGVSHWWTDAEFSVPLAVSLGTVEGKGELYASRFESMRFFEPKDGDPELAWQPPEGASWLDWDLAGPALMLDEARVLADFPLLEASAEEKGLTLARALRASPKVVPVLGLVYEQPPYYASVSEQKDRGLADPKALGVPVDLDGVPGRIAFAGDGACLVRFVRDGVDATILTNLPTPLALKLARSLRAKRP